MLRVQSAVCAWRDEGEALAARLGKLQAQGAIQQQGRPCHAPGLQTSAKPRARVDGMPPLIKPHQLQQFAVCTFAPPAAPASKRAGSQSVVAKHDAEHARLVQRKAHISACPKPRACPGGCGMLAMAVAPWPGAGSSSVKPLRHQLGQDGLAVGKVVVRRLVGDAGAAGHFAQAQALPAPCSSSRGAAGVQDALAQDQPAPGRWCGGRSWCCQHADESDEAVAVGPAGSRCPARPRFGDGVILISGLYLTVSSMHRSIRFATRHCQVN